MPIEYKAHRPSSSLLADLNWLLDEALEQAFPTSDPVAIDIDRESHDCGARVFDSGPPLAGTRKARERTTQKRVASGDRVRNHRGICETITVALTYVATFRPASRLFK
jgi:hypothetical protein